MTHPKALLFSFTLLIAAFSFQGDWIKFETATSRISFPAAPKNDSTVKESAIGKLTLFTHMLEVSDKFTDSNLVYGLIETEYPKDYFDGKTDDAFLKGFFDGAINGALKSINGKLISQKDVSYKNVPGKEVSVDYGNGLAVITMRFYLQGIRMFAIQTISMTGKENNQNKQRFFDSFEIK